jgi:NAD(P)-dependent dehydrogenase (short-subunit alcohol dehydrogenase family)
MIELTDEETDVLRRLLRAVGGVVPEFVIAGGQAARLLRLHPLATRLEWNPLLTTDTDVANACLFLASDVSRQITGIDLPVDGGWAML